MPDMSGCDVLDALSSRAQTPLVVFVTAYDEYAVDAFEREAVDYLLKPFDEMRFRTTLRRVRRQLASRGRGEGAHGANVTRRTASRYLRRLAVPSHGRVVLISAADIDCIEAAANYVCIHTGRQTHLLRASMNALEERLDPDRFVRIHRSTIVNLDRIRELRPWSGGEQKLVLLGGRELTIGRAFRDGLTARIAALSATRLAPSD